MNPAAPYGNSALVGWGSALGMFGWALKAVGWGVAVVVLWVAYYLFWSWRDRLFLRRLRRAHTSR